jgi:signal transduction histidine kinase
MQGMRLDLSASLPPEHAAADRARRLRIALVQCRIGVFFTLLFAFLYHALGSSWSGASLLPISAWLAVTPWLLRREVTLFWVSHVALFLAWSAFFVVAYRTGGFTSPALVWTFLLPLTCYSGCGRGSAIFWAVLSALQLLGFCALSLTGHQAPQDLPELALELLRITGYMGVVITTILVLLVMDSARLDAVRAQSRAERALERQRILSDMHDGAGSQLLWLLLSARRGALDRAGLLTGLESCLADLRLIADASEPDMPCSHALAQLRERLTQACESAGVTLDWRDAPELEHTLEARKVLQLCRALQEAVTNALRHAHTERLEVRVEKEPQGRVCIQVRDFGTGFDPAAARCGRGLRNMRARADELGGELSVAAGSPGTIVSLRFPVI